MPGAGININLLLDPHTTLGRMLKLCHSPLSQVTNTKYSASLRIFQRPSEALERMPPVIVVEGDICARNALGHPGGCVGNV